MGIKPLVSVAVLTYNSESTICQCIDSILMQEADFDFEIVVGDDCSTDGTPGILADYSERYPGKFVLLLNEENEGVSRNNNNVLSHCNGKYVAMCEGDDYWLDKEKLSRQVDFFFFFTDYGFVGSPCAELLPNGEMKAMDRTSETGRWVLLGDVFESTKIAPIIRTPSLCFRISIIKPYLSYVGAGNDAVLQVILARYSLFARWTLPMAVYRIGGISNGHYSMEKELKYNDYLYNNEYLKHVLFPNDCGFNENFFLDRADYIRLKYAIREKNWKKAVKIKKRLRTLWYRKKKYAKYLKGPISCFFLSFVLNRNE